LRSSPAFDFGRGVGSTTFEQYERAPRDRRAAADPPLERAPIALHRGSDAPTRPVAEDSLNDRRKR
jgi:hypothetical protein